ncbi:hypothetical protein AHAS_Ahas13G0308100 [Arachis hypogaea]
MSGFILRRVKLDPTGTCCVKSFWKSSTLPRKQTSCEERFLALCNGMGRLYKLLLDAASGGSLTKNKTAAKAWEVISDLADSTQHSRARSPQPKTVNEISPSGDAILTKTLGEMTIMLR